MREAETAQHQRAKADIAAACAAAGYETFFEAQGDGWRADVLARHPKQPGGGLAFEVQWSPLTLEDALFRQARYADSGVRGCWLFRLPPPSLQTADPLRLRARRDLPLFRLLVNADASFHVALNGRLHPLDEFITRLLRRRVRFCAAALAQGEQRLRLGFVPVRCGGCGRITHALTLEGALLARCGALFEPDEDTAAALLALSGVQAAARALADEEGYLFGGAVCGACAVPLDPAAVERARYQFARPRTVRADDHDPSVRRVRLDAPISGKVGHWCAPDDDLFCCEAG